MASLMRYFRRRFGRTHRHRSATTPSFDVTDTEPQTTKPDSPPAEPMRRWYSMRTRRRPKVNDAEAGAGNERGNAPFRRSWSLRLSRRRTGKKRSKTDATASGTASPDSAVSDTRFDAASDPTGQSGTETAVLDVSPASASPEPPSHVKGGQQPPLEVEKEGNGIAGDTEFAADLVAQLDLGSQTSAYSQTAVGSQATTAAPGVNNSSDGQEMNLRDRTPSHAPEEEEVEERAGSVGGGQTVDPTSGAAVFRNITVVSVKRSVSPEENASPPPSEVASARISSSSPLSPDFSNDVFVSDESDTIEEEADFMSPLEAAAAGATPSSVQDRVLKLEVLSGSPADTRARQRKQFSESSAQISPSPAKELFRQRSKSESDTALLSVSPGEKPSGAKTVRFDIKLEKRSKSKKKDKKKDKAAEEGGAGLPTASKGRKLFKKKKSKEDSDADQATAEPGKTKSKKKSKAEKHGGAGPTKEECDGKENGQDKSPRGFLKLTRSKTAEGRFQLESIDGDPTLKSTREEEEVQAHKLPERPRSICVSEGASAMAGVERTVPNGAATLGHEKEALSKSLQYRTPPASTLHEVDEDNDSTTDSGSEDEKGGTIKFKPLRHVSLKEKVNIDDETVDRPLIQYVFIVALKLDKKSKKLNTEITYNFPPAGIQSSKDPAIQAIPQFCFPDIDQWKPTTQYKSETFSFVLTDMEGNRRFGYCRRLLPAGSGPRLPEVYCIVSTIGCFSLYSKILDHMEERRAVSAAAVFTFLKTIVANPFPRPGKSIQVRVISTTGGPMDEVEFARPMDSRLEHVNFSLLFSTLSARKIIQIISSMMMERRIILAASSLSLISSCGHALLALLYPFEWQHVFIPVLPSNLIEFVCSPMPYLIGINPSCIKLLDTMEGMEEALVVDLDRRKLVRKIGDETSILPSKLYQYLENCLGSTAVSSEYSKSSQPRADPSRADEIVVNTFMTVFVYLFGDYREYMIRSSMGRQQFQKADYVKKFSSKSTQRFLDAFQMTQMFEMFIEQRENPAKAATAAESLFDKQMISQLRPRLQEIEIFSSKPSRFGRLKKGWSRRK